MSESMLTTLLPYGEYMDIRVGYTVLYSHYEVDMR